MTRITNTILSPSIPNPQYKIYLNGRLILTLITPNRPSRCVSWNYNPVLCKTNRVKIFKMAAFEEHMCEKGGFLFVIFNHVNVCAEEWEFFYGSVAFLGTAQ